MINRREMLKSIGIAAGMFGTVKVSATTASTGLQPYEVIGGVYNRIQRYREYERFYNSILPKKDYIIDELINPIAGRIFEDVLGGKRVADLPPFTKRTFPPFKIGMIVFNAALYGDCFIELGFSSWAPLYWHHLPCDTMWRIETTKGELVEFQQSKEGPDYKSLSMYPINKADQDVHATSVRFHPDQIVHIRVNCEKHYPYGTSCFEQQKHGKNDDNLVLGKPILDDQFIHDVTEGVRELVSRFKL